MYRLAGALDDVCDHIDEAAGNVLSYGIHEIRPQARAQAEVIHRSATKLQAAVGCLDGFKDASRELDELRELEDEGDRLNRDAVSELFRSTERRDRDHPLEGHPRAARGGGRRLRERG